MKKVVLLLLLSIFLLIPSQAKIGYKVDVKVDGNTWCVERSTTNLTFMMKGFVKGNGKSLRQQSIENLAGLKVKECSHSKDGKLSIIEEEIVIAREGAYEVDKQVENDSVSVNINENWPTFIKVNKLISYSGEGISNFEEFRNDEDVVRTKFYSKKIVKLTSYTTNLVSLSINAKIAEDVVVSKRYNRSINYKLKSGIADGTSKICYRVGNLKGAESYFGNFRIDKEIQYREKIRKINATNATLDWLNCIK